VAAEAATAVTRPEAPAHTTGLGTAGTSQMSNMSKTALLLPPPVLKPSTGLDGVDYGNIATNK
jgi:hypothetical protein